MFLEFKYENETFYELISACFLNCVFLQRIAVSLLNEHFVFQCFFVSL